MTSRISATVEDRVKEKLDNLTHVNNSALINDLLEAYLFGGDDPMSMTTEQAALKHEKKKLQHELEEEKETLERKQNRLQEVLDDLKELEEKGRPEDLVESFETLNRVNGSLDVSNPAVQTHAGKRGMDPEKFLGEFREWREEEGHADHPSTRLKSTTVQETTADD
ncbi:hypothetical protein [Haladaptatus salinisoli]|uniref:hypothetical protein n=1 Tax=Haladaptatus salinisoli TaxID=2884876 RepID=UPI001D0A6B8E|nr:hypothetical protein [Haladaptatus salinisoli]